MRSRNGSRVLRGDAPEVILPNSLMSAPATKVRPAPMTTAASTAESAFISSIAVPMASGTPGLRAFTGGLSMVMTATSFSLVLFTNWFIGQFLIFLSQLPLQNLPRGGPRQALGKFNRLRTLVMGQTSAAELDQFPFGQLASWFGYYYCPRHLTPFLIRHGDHCGFENSGVRGQHLFDVERRDVFTAAHDNVLLPIDDSDVSVRRDHCHVAGAKPSAA